MSNVRMMANAMRKAATTNADCDYEHDKGLEETQANTDKSAKLISNARSALSEREISSDDV